jgi:outer membrane protein assembly factor BamB
VDGDDNVIVCGSTSISTTDALLAKYDSTGTLLWQRTFGDVRVDIFETPVIDGDGNIYVTGLGDGNGAPATLIVVKYNASGTLQWQRGLDPDDADFEAGGFDLAISDEGLLYAVGYLYDDASGTDDLLLVCFDLDGVLQWQRTISVDDASDTVFGNGVAVRGSHVVVSGAIFFGSVFNNFVARLRANGEGTEGFELAGNAMTYAESTVDEDATTFTDTAGALTSATSTLTDAAGTLTSATATLTQSIVYL